MNYKITTKIVLAGMLCLFGFIIWQTRSMDKPKKMFIDMEHVEVGQPVIPVTEQMGKSEISRCVWYVGDREVSRTEELSSYIPTEEDLEKFIRVSVTLKDGSCYEDSLYFSVLPVLYVESETGYDDVTKEAYAESYVKLAAGGRYLPTEQYEGTAYIHLRGNATSTLPKHPLKMKLEKNADLLGLGKTKHWVLLANAIDATLLRNKLVYDFSGDIGADCKMNSENVSLIYNGEYQGVYQLCEQIRIGQNSVDIFDWENLQKDVAEEIVLDLIYQKKLDPNLREVVQVLLEADLTEDFSWMEDPVFRSPSLSSLNENDGYDIPTTFDIREYVDFAKLPDATGGVLLEMDCFHNKAANLKTNYALPIYYNKPQYGNSYKELHSYIREYLQALEYAFHETDFTYHDVSPHYKLVNEGWVDDERQRKGVAYKKVSFTAKEYEDCHYSDLIDFDSLLVNFLVCEVSMNWDSMKNSVYLYKDIDGPLYIGPAWDYDWAWGNSNYKIDTWAPESWHTTNEFFSNEEYYQTVQWNRYLIRDPYFLVCIYEKYWEIRDTVIEEMIREGGLIDEYANHYQKAADANDERWGGSMGDYKGQKFKDGIAMMKEFLNQRIRWMDAQFSDPETLRKSLGYYVISDDITVDLQDEKTEREVVKLSATVQISECSVVSFQVNGIHFYCAPVQNGVAEIEIPADTLRMEEKSFNTVQVRAMDGAGNYLINQEGTVEEEYRNAISNYVYF